jgi:acyl carrier protein
MNLHQNEILSQIFAVLRKLESGAQYGDLSGDTAISTLQLDSMGITQLVIELETHFDLSLPDAELARMATLSDLAECIRAAGLGGAARNE